MQALTTLLAAVTMVALCAGEVDAQAPPAEPPVGKVAVSARGTITFDGTAVTLDGLKTRLEALKQRAGVVWYYREAPAGEPPAQAMQAIGLVTDLGLPISLSTKPDYSDVLLPDGTTRPRQTDRRR